MLPPVGAAPGRVVKSVAGWFAVFQVAAVGQAVTATVGDGSLKTVGPGTGSSMSDTQFSKATY